MYELVKQVVVSVFRQGLKYLWILTIQGFNICDIVCWSLAQNLLKSIEICGCNMTETFDTYTNNQGLYVEKHFTFYIVLL